MENGVVPTDNRRKSYAPVLESDLKDSKTEKCGFIWDLNLSQQHGLTCY